MPNMKADVEVLSARIRELEEALAMAIEDLEAYRGSDAEDNETMKYLNSVMGYV